MKARFSRRALRQLQAISAYINEKNPQGALNVRDAILATIGMLSRSPSLGRRQDRRGLRKLVVPRYPYLIYYAVDETTGNVNVLKVRHAARKREHQDV